MSVEREIESAVGISVKKPRGEAIEEIASTIQETKRIPDYYEFILTPHGEFYSLSHKCIVKRVVEHHSYLGQAEYEALEKAEKIASEKNSGLIVWISPPNPYPATKIIYYEIVKTSKVTLLRNHAAIYDGLTNFETFQLACDLANLGCNPILYDLEDVRRNSLYIPTDSIHWTYLVGEYLTGEQADYYSRMIRSKEDVILKEKAIREAEILFDQLFSKPDHNAYKLSPDQRQMFGDNGLGCPPLGVAEMTAFELMFKLARREGWSGSCPICGTYNTGLMPGDRCRGCRRIYKGCG